MDDIYRLSTIVDTPKYHKDKLYNIVWDIPAKLPALICDLKDLSIEYYEKYLNYRTSDKISVLYFTTTQNCVCAIISLSDTEPFTHESIYRYKKQRKCKIKIDPFNSSVALAYFCSMKVTGEERIKYTKDIYYGCCKCLEMSITAENGLEGYIYCEECCLTYHWKCEGFCSLPLDSQCENYKYVCNKCRLYYIKHPDRIGKNSNYLLSQNIGKQIQYSYRIPEYHIGCLYEVVWDKRKVYPGIICRCKELTIEAFEKYLSSDIEKKIPIIYFCAKYPIYGVTSYDDLVSFNHNSISIYRNKHTNKKDLSEFQSAVTTAFFCRGIEVLDKRLNYLSEDKTGCCGCFSINIDVDKDGLDSYVYCDECLLAYHWICAGYTEIPEDYEDPEFKYICKRCIDKQNKLNNEENMKRKHEEGGNVENSNKKKVVI